MNEALPDQKPRRQLNFARQLLAFAVTIQTGDLVILPRKLTSLTAIGRVSGPYRFSKVNSEARHARPVEWLQTDIPRTAFEQDLLYSFGAFMTVCNISRNDAARRVSAVLEGKADPGPPVPTGTKTKEPPPTEDQSEAVPDLVQMAQDQIVARIQSRISGHALTRLVDAVLQVEGWVTKVSPPGPDGGVDILAGRGSLGLDGPRLCVQVKSQQSPADVTVYRTLRGTMQTFNAEQGLLVCWGGFIREVFPVYYVAIGATSVAAAVLLAFGSAERGADALAMACIGIVFFLARFVLLPIINRNRDAGQGGDVAAKKRFDVLHRVSVIVNLVQMLAVLVVLVRYVVQ